MLRDAAVSKVQQLLGFRSDKTAEIIQEFQDQQNELENSPELPFFLRTEVEDMVSVVDDERMALPEGFIREWDEDALWIKANELGEPQWSKLVKDGPAYLRESLQLDVDDTTAETVETGRPIAYAIAKEFSTDPPFADDTPDIILFPAPKEIFTFRMIYYKKDHLLTSNIENRWLKYLPFLLIGKVGLVMGASFRDKEAIQIFGAFVAEGTKRLHELTTAQDGAGRKYVIGGED